MQIVVLHGRLSEEEQNLYVSQAIKKYPVGLIEKLILDVQGDFVEISYIPHKFRELRKMGGYCIGAPEDWNPAKQAEFRDTVPNSF